MEKRGERMERAGEKSGEGTSTALYMADGTRHDAALNAAGG
jgi:hypothetical protein